MSILPQQPYVSVITPSQGDRQYYLRQCGDSIDMIRACGIPLDWIIASPVAPGVPTKHTHVLLERAVSPAVARNAALGAVTTPWVANVDDDDFLAPGFATVVTKYVGSPLGGSVYFSVSQDYYSDGTAVQWRGQLKPGYYAPEDYRVLASHYPLAIHPSTMLARTDLLLEQGGWNIRLGQAEDIDCALKMAHNYGFCMTDLVTHNYRKHPQQMTRSEKVAEADADIISAVYRANGIIL